MDLETTIRLNPHGSYKTTASEAISLEYDMEAGTTMDLVVTAHNFDRDHFGRCAKWHEVSKFRAISHGNEKPFVITTTKDVPWTNYEISPAKEIMRLAEIERCESLCLTHFAYVTDDFPLENFEACMRQVMIASNYTNLKKVLIDVDSNQFDLASSIYLKIQKQVERRKFSGRIANGYQRIIKFFE